jgi:integrase
MRKLGMDVSAAKASTMKRTTALKIVGLLREILDHALEDGYIHRNPAANLGRFYRGRAEEEARAAVVPLTTEEVRRLLEACARWYPEFWEVIAMAAWSGMREGEILGLQWQDLDVAGRFAEMRRTISSRGGRVNVGSPKSGRARRVDLPGMLVGAPGREKVAPGGRGGPPGPRSDPVVLRQSRGHAGRRHELPAPRVGAAARQGGAEANPRSLVDQNCGRPLRASRAGREPAGRRPPRRRNRPQPRRNQGLSSRTGA